ncbi:MAG: hypothetical protein DCC52_19270 [Chloroflexi bacterium]|nr:MAG: hypothetical protein DCC52_19270 [Chloroflexota bacterium]
MKPLFPLPAALVPPASDAAKLFDAGKYDETIAACHAQLDALEKQFPARNLQTPQTAEAGSAIFQYYALTALLVNALAAQAEWKKRNGKRLNKRWANIACVFRATHGALKRAPKRRGATPKSKTPQPSRARLNYWKAKRSVCAG